MRKAVREEVLERDGSCRAAGIAPGRCWHPSGLALDVHEVIPRGRWRAGYLVAENAVAVCRSHHHWITTHPEEATKLGLTKSRRPR